ncbi:MAG: hypothetical protein AAB268_02865 [Elusimicrobiota bacterium]
MPQCGSQADFAQGVYFAEVEVAGLVEGLRRRILRRMLRMRVLPEATVSEMLAWPHGSFSPDALTRVEVSYRAGLERLLLYVLRPALSLNQLTYAPEQDLVRYRPGGAARSRPDESIFVADAAITE